MTPELDTLLDLAIDFAANPDPAVLARALAEARRLAQDEATAHILLGQTLYGAYLGSDDTGTRTPLQTAAIEVVADGGFDPDAPAESLGLPLAVGDLREVPALAETIEAARQALRLRPDDADAMALLGSALHDTFTVTADVNALREAVECWATVLDAHPEIGAYRMHFAVALIALDPWEDEPRDLDAALEILAGVIQFIDRTSAERALPMLFLTEGLAARYERTFDRVTLDRAQVVITSTLELLGEDHPLTPRAVHLLGCLLTRRYEVLGDRPALHAAVACHHQAVDGDPSAPHLAALVESLRLRWLLDGDEMWMAEANTTARQALELARSGDADRHAVLFATAGAVLDANTLAEDDELVEMAVDLLRVALGCLPAAHPRRDAYTARLADAWLVRARTTGAVVDLAGALEATAQSLRLVSADHPSRPEHLSRYGTGFIQAYRETEDVEHLYKAVLTMNRAVESVPEDHPAWARLMTVLGEATLLVADATEDAEAHTAAEVMFQKAAMNRSATAPVKAAAALKWAAHAAAAGKWLAAATAYMEAIGALQAMTALQVSRWAQEERLAEFAGVASNAAATALHLDKPENALLLLEMGRGVLLARELLLTTGLAKGSDVATDLAEHVDARNEATDMLDEVLEDMERADEFVPHRAIEAARRLREATSSIVSLLRDTRRPDGERGYAAVPTTADAVAHSRDGAIVYLNISEYRSDALIVTPAGVSVLPLAHPDCGPERVETEARRLVEASRRGLTGPMALRRVVPDILAWLWTTMVEPVLTALGHKDSPDPLPRVWWIPTGYLSLLPLHAAGLPNGPSALDRVISSYTPTVRALSYARRPSVAHRTQTVVAMSRTAGESDLPSTLHEALALNDPRYATPPLVDDEATRDRVLSALRDTTWAHFACHAANNMHTPARSGLLLHDNLLPVTDITRLRLPDAELAYLSACTTARTGGTHADEAIHLAGAFQLAGYRHVIGTLWPLNDALAAEASTEFYKHLADTHTARHAATALHRVVRDLRDRHPDHPDLWACVSHYGA